MIELFYRKLDFNKDLLFRLLEIKCCSCVGYLLEKGFCDGEESVKKTGSSA